jgi:hypothetical protein
MIETEQSILSWTHWSQHARAKTVSVRLLGPGSKQEIALVNLSPGALQGIFFLNSLHY